MGDLALKVEGLTKEYRLGTIGYGTMREDLQTWWARVRGKDDPNSLITASHHSESEMKHFLALNDINFEIKKGDRVGIIGRNGAGKSTLLKILSRITSPTKGNIYIDGRIGSLLEVGTGFHQELTGRENIYLNGSILGMKRKEIDKKLDEIVDFAGIEKFIDTPVKRYSSGMFVRLGFAVAAHLEPEILIIDEVLAVGDVEFQKKAIGKMEDVSNNEGRTILFVSHNMRSIKALCNKGILLNQGTIECHDEIYSVVDQYLNKFSSIENNKLYSNEFFSFKDIRIEKYERKGLVISNSESIHVNLEFEIKKGLSDYYMAFMIDTVGGEAVWHFRDYESEIMLPKKKGNYSMVFKIPKFLFNEGNFLFRIAAVDSLSGERLDYQEPFIFSIYNEDQFRSGSNLNYTKKGLLGLIPNISIK